MGQFKVTHSYVALDKAGASLGVSVDDLIHAGAFNQVQICVNIYARGRRVGMNRIYVALDGDYTDWDEQDRGEAQAHEKIFSEWIQRLKCNKMPAGIYELTQDDLRRLELPENTHIDIGEAFKSDERGLWEVDFDPLVEISRSDLVMLTTEIERITKTKGERVASMDKPLTIRERTSYLNIIGAMLAQLTQGKNNDTGVIQQAINEYGTKPGVSERKLHQVFAEAKRSLGAS